MEDKMTDAQKEAPIRIDHDNVDVADIMDQIKQRIAQRLPAPAGAPAATRERPPGAVPVAPGGGGGLARRVLRLLVRPFMPIVRPLLDRFFVRVNPVVNMRIDEMSGRLNMRMDEMSGRLITTQENTKLLHTLAHNLVLDLTKLRIEHEALKSKTRIMEKDFEMLGKREKVLEKRMTE